MNGEGPCSNDLIRRFLFQDVPLTRDEVRIVVRHLLRKSAERPVVKSSRGAGRSALILGSTATPRRLRRSRPLTGPGDWPPFFSEREVRGREAPGRRGDDSADGSVSLPAELGRPVSVPRPAAPPFSSLQLNHPPAPLALPSEVRDSLRLLLGGLRRLRRSHSPPLFPSLSVLPTDAREPLEQVLRAVWRLGRLRHHGSR